MPSCLHPNSHHDSSLPQLAIKPFGFTFAVHQSLFSALSCFVIYIRNLLKARVIIYAYNQHIRLLLPSLGWFGIHQVYAGLGADVVMESVVSSCHFKGSAVPSSVIFVLWLARTVLNLSLGPGHRKQM